MALVGCHAIIVTTTVMLAAGFTDAIRHLNMSLASNNIDRHIAARDVQGAGVADPERDSYVPLAYWRSFFSELPEGVGF